jgi:peptidoglycan/xylan/chitin deacetylase (PgdA/CDA1 family)
VAFTFDDGPHHLHTARLLQILAQHRIRAAFFVNGCWIASGYPHAEENRAVLREAHAGGHIVGNHTFHHVNLAQLSREEQTWEILANEELIQEVIGTRPLFFRPPYALLSRHALTLLRDEGYAIARWNSAAWDEEDLPADQIRDAVMTWIRKHEGGIIMLHDRNRHSVDAVPLIVRALQRENSQRGKSGRPPLRVVPLDSFLVRPSQSEPFAGPVEGDGERCGGAHLGCKQL